MDFMLKACESTKNAKMCSFYKYFQKILLRFTIISQD